MGIEPMQEWLRRLPCLPWLKCEPLCIRSATNLLIRWSWQHHMKTLPLIKQENMVLVFQSPDQNPNRMLEKSQLLLLHTSSAFKRADLLQHGGQQVQVQRLDEVMIKTCVFGEYPVLFLAIARQCNQHSFGRGRLSA